MLPQLDDDGGLKGNLEDRLQAELDFILQGRQQAQSNFQRERDLNIFRSGSAPPTVDGSLTAVGSLFSNSSNLPSAAHALNPVLTEDEIRSHPDYLSYYYSNDNINPRLPPPLLSKEDWRVARRFQAGGSNFGGLDNWGKKTVDASSSLFLMQPENLVHQAENDLLELRNASRSNISRNASNDGFSTALAMDGLGARRKSFADIVQVCCNW